jgi:hypothetical protein
MTRIVCSSGLALVLVAVTAGAAEAQAKPFMVSGGGFAPQGVSLVPGMPRPHSLAGVATHLGNYAGAGMFQITPPVPGLAPNQASFSSAPYCVFVAANGDQLVVTYGKGGTGVVTLTPVGNNYFTAYFVAEFNPVPELCTGRFRGVTGSWLMIAQSSPFTFVSPTDTSPFAYTWQGQGTLIFPKGK